VILKNLCVCRGDGEDDGDDDEYDVEEQTGFLLIRRQLSEQRPQKGKPVTVTIEIFNSGTA
jgi:hypothetical protein